MIATKRRTQCAPAITRFFLGSEGRGTLLELSSGDPVDRGAADAVASGQHLAVGGGDGELGLEGGDLRRDLRKVGDGTNEYLKVSHLTHIGFLF